MSLKQILGFSTMAKLLPNPIENKYYLVFCDHGVPPGGLLQNMIRLFLNRLKTGFSHVRILQKTPLGAWLIIDSCNNGLDISIDANPYLLTRYRSNPAFTVVEVSPEQSGVKLRGLITCVSVAKYLLGISRPGIITPYQLYKYVINQRKD